MEEQSKTEYDTSIPLRDNGSRAHPNPYVRLEAADHIRLRLHVLAGLLAMHPEPPDRNAIAAVIETLAVDTQTSIWGCVEHVRGLLDSAPASLWAQTVESLLWPSRVAVEPED